MKKFIQSKGTSIKGSFNFYFLKSQKNMHHLHFYFPSCQTYVIQSLLELEQLIPTAPYSLPDKAAYNTFLQSTFNGPKIMSIANTSVFRRIVSEEKMKYWCLLKHINGNATNAIRLNFV